MAIIDYLERVPSSTNQLSSNQEFIEFDLAASEVFQAPVTGYFIGARITNTVALDGTDKYSAFTVTNTSTSTAMNTAAASANPTAIRTTVDVLPITASDANAVTQGDVITTTATIGGSGAGLVTLIFVAG